MFYAVVGFDVVENGREVVDGAVPLADAERLRTDGITPLAFDQVADVAAVLYLRELADESTSEATTGTSGIELMVFRTEPQWEPLGSAGGREPFPAIEVLDRFEASYPARRACHFMSHGADDRAAGVSVEALRCHPQVGSVVQGDRSHYVPDHGWLVMIVEPGADWQFVDRDGTAIGPGPFA